MIQNRAGIFIMQSAGYQSFQPKKLPPDPSLKMDTEMIHLLSLADRKLGRLDGVTQILPNPDLFVAMYVQKEALLSSQIEGTQASLIDILNTEHAPEKKADIDEIVNYVKAVNYGLDKLDELPLSLRLIRDIHAVLLEQGRGSSKTPGEFRRTQNWIGASGSTLANAAFIPPSVPDMQQALNELELFIYEEDEIPALIKIALIHAQFETIHPFLDGNGRMGRLLITFWLCQQKILSKPLLYLSYYFKKNRQEYYDRLTDIRSKGLWEDWVKFFLRGVAEVSDEATASAKQIIQLKDRLSKTLYDLSSGNANYQKFLEILFRTTVLTKNMAASLLDITHPTASSLVDDFCKFNILEDGTPHKIRGKVYIFKEYMDILSKGTEIAPR